MTRYFTKVDPELLPDLREGSRMPDGLRLVAEFQRLDDGHQLVAFEDAGAPPEMEDALVTPTVSIDYGPGTLVERTWISNRHVECWFGDVGWVPPAVSEEDR